MFHVIRRPYKENMHNVADFCLLALIPTVLGISSYQLVNVITSNTISQVAMAIQIILLYLPLIYLASIVVYKLYRWRRPYKIDDGASWSEDLELKLYAAIDDSGDNIH